MKQTSYITSYFYNKRFSGDPSQSITLTLHDYRQCAVLYELDDRAMATKFTATLEDPARAFFLSNFKQGMSYQDIEKFMPAEYYSNNRQLQVRRKLESLRIKQVMEEKNLNSADEAMRYIINFIDTLVPQCPPTFRNDENKICFLLQAVVKEPG